MAATTSSNPGYDDLMALAHDARFLNRVQAAIVVIALQVCTETPQVAARRAFAQQVLGNPGAAAAACAVAIVNSPNVDEKTLTYTADGGVTSAATDADLASQVNSLWNVWAGL